jgi:3-hydroxyisobutyrate dehydrogenase-like beta-hydroxyacid dehydrogenase
LGRLVTGVALVGLGEVGRVLGEDLSAVTLTTWDTAFADPQSPASRHAAALGLDAPSLGLDAAAGATAVARAEVVISAVTAANTLAAARSCAPGLRPGTWYLDLNSASPAQKQAAAQVIGAAGGRYVEAAVMSPINPKRLAAPMLLGGPDAAGFTPIAESLGFTGIEVYADTVGPAAATKLCRSVVVKGLEALLTESMLTARAWGVEERVLASLSNMVPSADWPTLAAYMMSRSLEHGARRAEEMREAARTVEETGITPWMATATAERQDWAAAFRADSAPNDLSAMLDAVRAALTDVGATS